MEQLSKGWVGGLCRGKLHRTQGRRPYSLYFGCRSLPSKPPTLVFPRLLLVLDMSQIIPKRVIL